MKDLRERCEKLADELVGYCNKPVPSQTADMLEAFAREIRNEALEEAYMIAETYTDHEGHNVAHEAAKKIRVLALAASAKEEKDSLIQTLEDRVEELEAEIKRLHDKYDFQLLVRNNEKLRKVVDAAIVMREAKLGRGFKQACDKFDDVLHELYEEQQLCQD